MTLTDSITFWAGQFVWKLVVSIVVIIVALAIAYVTQDRK